MADTCYLCSVGSGKQVNAQATATEGFGTCTTCSVHACQRHGDRDPKRFRCADCVTSTAVQTVVSPDPQAQRAIEDHGQLAFFAQSPMLSIGGIRLFDPAGVPRMNEVLDRLGREPVAATSDAQASLVDALGDLDTFRLVHALGLDEHRVFEQLGEDADRRGLLFDLARTKLRLIAGELEESLAGFYGRRFDAAQASYALAVLAVALGARDAESLDTSVLDLSGGLYLPPIIVLLSTMYARGL